MKLIVGLGNPGKEYENTRHNIGFAAVDYLEKKLKDKEVVLFKPQTYVNNSGREVFSLTKKLKLKAKDLIVIHDDLDIPFGRTKLSFGRSSAGHKGVDSIIRALKTDKFYRLRVGTFDGKVSKIRKIRDKKKRVSEMGKFVLGRFTPGEKRKLSKIMKEAKEKLESVL